jgi:F0F1-type ATP synthase membrane subunit b/b'
MSAARDPISEVERLLEELETFAEKSPWYMPNKVVIKDDDFFRITHRIRELLPSELAEARQLLEKREAILKNAQEEHRRILESAERRMEEMVSQEQVVVAAQREAERIIDRARSEGENVKRDALMYTSELLEDMEKQFQQTLQTVAKGKQFIESELSKGPVGADSGAAPA